MPACCPLGGSLWSSRLPGCWRAKRGARPAACRLLGAALVPARGWLESTYRSETTCGPWVLHAGLGPEDAFSGQIAKVIAFALSGRRAPIVKGGAKTCSPRSKP
jgi:phytoene dehydrogenase-like protein